MGRIRVQLVVIHKELTDISAQIHIMHYTVFKVLQTAIILFISRLNTFTVRQMGFAALLRGPDCKEYAVELVF